MAPHILFVDPERTLTASLAGFLSASGFDVTLAADFDEAAGVLRGHAFHAVVTAHRLGAHNGLHLLLRARMERPDVLAVVTTAVVDPHLEVEAGALGALCLVAPWQDAARLLEVLRTAGPAPA